MRFLKALLILLFILALTGGASLYGGWIWFQGAVERPGPSAEAQMFSVKPGEAVVTVAGRLQAEGLVDDARLVRLKARLDGKEAAIKVGTYDIPARESIADILARLVRGDVVTYRITIPEGLTTAQILRLVEADQDLTGHLPDPAPEEGALLPDTYVFDHGTTRAALIQRMQMAQDALLADLWPGRQTGLPFDTPQDAVILASVVEKETGKAAERATIAGLFVNRMKRGMQLQSDPTVIYGVSRGEPLYNRRGERRTLYRSELDRETPWNTYIIPGLPETPICNPGRDAIAAVLDPPDTDYVFFVADGTGGHRFARTLAEHTRNVADYRRYEHEEIARERAN